MKILDSIRGLLQARQGKDSATLGYLVDAIVSGNRDLKPDDAVASLDRLGLTVADLDDACQAEVRRRSLIDQAEAGRLALRELGGIDARIQAEWDAYQQQFKALDATYGPRITDLRERKKILQGIRDKGRDAENRLRELAPADLKDRQRQVRDERRAVASRREMLRDAVAVREGDLRRMRRSAEDAETAEAREHYEAQAKAVEERLAQLQAERDQLDQRDKDLKDEDAQVDAAMVELG